MHIPTSRRGLGPAKPWENSPRHSSCIGKVADAVGRPFTKKERGCMIAREHSEVTSAGGGARHSARRESIVGAPQLGRGGAARRRGARRLQCVFAQSPQLRELVRDEIVAHALVTVCAINTQRLPRKLPSKVTRTPAHLNRHTKGRAPCELLHAGHGAYFGRRDGGGGGHE